MKSLLLLTSSSITVMLGVMMLLPHVTNAQLYSGPCQEQCCCKVCSAPTNEAFPYGIPTTPIADNPTNPQVQGATCHFPVWSDFTAKDTDGNPVTPPDTLFWSAFNVFGDNDARTAGSSCSCCQVSVDTACTEVAPIGTRPKDFFIQGGRPVEYTEVNLHFQQGIELTTGDFVEFRNDTFCGYTQPSYVKRSNASELSISFFEQSTFEQTTVWNVKRLPPAGCYRLCYYHSTLTTPTWYDMGTITVYREAHPTAAVSYQVDPLDVPLESNDVTITFTGLKLLSVFDDIVELRTGGTCGTTTPVAPTMSTANAADGLLEVTYGHEWCKPAVVQRVTSIRPLRYITPVYGDCILANRIYQDKVQWRITLPATNTYTVCYYDGLTTTWHTLSETLTVSPQQTAATALNAFYAATGGTTTWTRNDNWGGANPCTFYGIRCNPANEVIGIHLSRNNVEGALPNTMFEAAFFKTLEYIALDENHISGTVPYSIGVLRNLKYLNLGVNQLTGTLPASLQKTSILQLYAPMNEIDGVIPKTLQDMNLLWANFNQIEADTSVTEIAYQCAEDPLECSDRGSTDTGVFECGYASISEEECVARGCCFNAQAPLVFGGTSCFTKRSAFTVTNPVCTNSIDCKTQLDPETI